MTYQSFSPSMSNSTSIYTTQYQEQVLNEAEKQRAREIGYDMVRHMIPNQSGLVEKVTGVSSIGGYRCIAQDFEALGHVKEPDPHSLHQQLYQKAREWFNPVGKSDGGRREARMYSQFKAFVYLIALLLQDKRKKQNLPLKRYLLPHRINDICGNLASVKQHDIAIRWQHPDTDIEAECRAFLDYEESKSNQKQTEPSANQACGQPNTESRTSKGNNHEVPMSDPEVNVTQSPFWRCFGVVECKADHNEFQEQAEYGKLGWYAASALEYLFERNNLWGWIISKTIVRFVFFTHGAVVSSEAIDMSVEEDRKEFIGNFIRLCICSAYRAGFDPTKEWLGGDNVWKVECYPSARKPRNPTIAYVKPLPLKARCNLLGRRTRCHRASLDKDAEEYELILKESWVELDHDPDDRKTLNTESLPNEVRIFRKINKNRDEFIDKCVPKMVAGGSVYLEKGIAPGVEDFSTVKKYCGELDIVTLNCDAQPLTQTVMEFDTDNDEPELKVANRVQQRLLLSPFGHSMTALHTWAHNPQYISRFKRSSGSELLVVYVSVIFARLFYIIHDLYMNCQVYHRDLSEGNVLVRENNGDPYPLLIDFDHARLCSDAVNDSMQFGMGTVPFMSILNLAGYSNKLSIIDELESFLYLCVWKCTIGFTPSNITRGKTEPSTSQVTLEKSSAKPRVQPVTRFKLTNQRSPLWSQRPKHHVDQTEELKIRSWAKGDPGKGCLDAKYVQTSSNRAFEMVLDELRPEFQHFKPLFLQLRSILFDWDGKQVSFFYRSNTGQEIAAPKDKSLRGRVSRGPLKITDKRTLKAGQKAGESSTSNDESNRDKYYQRLISRKEVAHEILDKFADAIDSFFKDYF
ncbi:hypothetical protein IWQ62_000653 [Dispira parvispora]|uniref:Fungal-type protein kinase domain-containing protein n=1 Tax=Dispira parvispora TaxID=1520584 RepID=A0A9W8E4S3_9FUNG|nr:hypothetical protein IWQ62_000653 [Dispira parvispora]